MKAKYQTIIIVLIILSICLADKLYKAIFNF